MRVQLSMCDNTSKMGILGLFYLVMDLATEHGDDINLGAKVLSPRGLFWVASKTKLKIRRMPEILENITASHGLKLRAEYAATDFTLLKTARKCWQKARQNGRL